MMLRTMLWASGLGVSLLVSACGGDDDASGSGGSGGSGGSETGGSGGSDTGGSGGSGTAGSGGSITGGSGTGGSSTGGSGTGGSSTGGSSTGGTGGSGGGSADPKPRGADAPPTLGAQIDRMGRAAIGTALIATFSADSDQKGMLKDAYNAAAPQAWSDFENEIRANLAILDSLDENCGNQLLAGASDPRYATLASILADDQLYVLSTVGECGVYLGLEGEIAGALEPGAGKCGGRSPDDDVIERSYSVLAAGLLTGVDDTITENDRENSDEFPFLALPH
ncbi:MAG TPA: hypothetical protein VFU02_20705 [Polyangiaceae bacterium]|nr:hypothetical protein [Polyangiaceae bacterium]